jgi:hypothetical protein
LDLKVEEEPISELDIVLELMVYSVGCYISVVGSDILEVEVLNIILL